MYQFIILAYMQEEPLEAPVYFDRFDVGAQNAVPLL